MPILKKKRGSLIDSIMKGPREIEQRLMQIECELERVMGRLTSLVALKRRLQKTGWLSPGSALPRVAAKLAVIGSGPLRELRAEREALRTFIGQHLRPWEVKPAGEPPQI